MKRIKNSKPFMDFEIKTFRDYKNKSVETENNFVESINQTKLGKDLFEVLINLRHRHFDLCCEINRKDKKGVEWRGLDLNYRLNPFNEKDKTEYHVDIEFNISKIMPLKEDSVILRYEIVEKEQIVLLFMRRSLKENFPSVSNVLLKSKI